MNNDPVNHPKHYTSHPSGIECIDVTRHMGFNLGNAVKYIWRADLKANAIEDLEKAQWYIADEIKRRKKSDGKETNREAPTSSEESRRTTCKKCGDEYHYCACEN